MAETKSNKGGAAATVCIVIILMTTSFVSGYLVSTGAIPWPFAPNGNGNGNTDTTTTDTTTDTTTTPPTTTTPVTTMPDPPVNTTYNLYLRVYYTNGLEFLTLTQGIVVLNDAQGNPDDTWNIIGPENSTELTGLSPVKRHTKLDTVGKSIVISVSSMAWSFEVTIGSSWLRTPEGIGDYLQTFTLSTTQSLECQVYLSPRWVGG